MACLTTLTYYIRFLLLCFAPLSLLPSPALHHLPWESPGFFKAPTKIRLQCWILRAWQKHETLPVEAE